MNTGIAKLSERLRDPNAYVDACDEAADLLEKLEIFNSPTGEIVLWFAGEMEKKLAANRHKGDAEAWRKDSPMDLHARVEDETLELWEAICDYTNAEVKERAMLERIIREAADVANFAMMIADQAQQALGVNDGAHGVTRPTAGRPDKQTERADSEIGAP